jgi:predicted ATPase
MFTDIEGSTRLHQRLGSDYGALQARHDALVRAAVDRHGGVVVRTMGDGVFAAFGSADGAAAAAVAVQTAISGVEWDHGERVRVRIGLHCGEAESRDADYVSLSVNQAARVSAAAHGGQILATGDVVAACASAPEATPLGAFRLKDFDTPVELVQLDWPGQPTVPAIRAVPAAAHNIPAFATRYIGRESDLEQVSSLVAGHRLVTICGAGGAGKTRFAMHFAASHATEYADGAWIVLLATATRPDEVTPRIASALGLPGGDTATVDDLVDHVRSRAVLVVVDNCEHLHDEVARVVGRLVADSEQARFIATSREPLGVDGELVWRLPPLTLPAAWSSAEEAGKSDSVRLFVDRAAAAEPAFVLDDKALPHVLEICRAVDGLPLALELAAARLRHLSLADTASRLGERLRILTGGGRDLPDRQRTLRATLDWSYDLLTEPEQLAFRRLATFHNHFSLDDAEAVVGYDPLRPDDVLDLVTTLIDRSLLLVDDTAGRVGYRMLVVIHEYARLQLVQSGDEDSTRERQATLLHQRYRKRLSGAPVDGALHEDEADAYAVFWWAHNAGKLEQQFAMQPIFWGAAFTSGRFDAAIEALDALLADGRLTPLQRATALYDRGLLRMIAASATGAAEDIERYWPDVDEAKQLALEHDLGTFAGAVWHLVGDAHGTRGDWDEAITALERALPLSDEPPQQLNIRRAIAIYRFERDRAADSVDAVRQILDEMRQFNALSVFEVARTENVLAGFLAAAGDTEALVHAAEAARLAADYGADLEVSKALYHACTLMQARNDTSTVAVMADLAVRLCRERALKAEAARWATVVRESAGAASTAPSAPAPSLDSTQAVIQFLEKLANSCRTFNR